MCEQCDTWALTLHPAESGFTAHRTVGVRRVSLASADGCDFPCPAPEPPEDVKRANEALRGRVFFHVGMAYPHPFLFRTKAACEEYRKVHRFDRDEPDAWHAGRPRSPELSAAGTEED